MVGSRMLGFAMTFYKDKLIENSHCKYSAHVMKP